MKTNFEIILNGHRRIFSPINMYFSKEKTKQINNILSRGLLTILLLINIPSYIIAYKTDNGLWSLTTCLFFLFFFVIEWFYINPYGINKFSDKKIKFSFKSWINEGRIQDRVKKMSEFYSIEEVRELKNIALIKLEQLKGINFKKIEIIIVSIIGLFITKYFSFDLLYRFIERNFNNEKPLTVIQKDEFIIFSFVLLLITIILYQYIKLAVNQKWIDKKNRLENFIKDIDDIIIEKIIN